MVKQQYFCPVKQCAIHAGRAGFPNAGNCPVCGHPLAPANDRQPQAPASSDKPSGTLIDRLPFPVAYPWHMSLNQNLDPVRRVNNMIFTAYQAMRLTGLLLLSDYLESSESCPPLGRYLARMHMPHWREWKSLTDALAKYISGNNPRYPPSCTFFCTSLAETWRSLGRQWKKTDQASEFSHNNQILTPMEIFQVFRNDRAHHQGVQDGLGDDESLLAAYLPVLDFLLTRLFAPEPPVLHRLPMTGTPEARECGRLLADAAATRVPLVSLTGVHEDLCFAVETEELDQELRAALANSHLVARIEGHVLPVYPFFLALDLETGDSGGLLEPVFMADGFSVKRVAYMGVKHHRGLPGLGRKVVELLAAKQH
jgi:hypothetical protein